MATKEASKKMECDSCGAPVGVLTLTTDDDLLCDGCALEIWTDHPEFMRPVVVEATGSRGRRRDAERLADEVRRYGIAADATDRWSRQAWVQMATFAGIAEPSQATIDAARDDLTVGKLFVLG